MGNSVDAKTAANPLWMRWSSAIPVLDTLLNAAREFSGAHSVAEALSVDLADLARQLGMYGDVESISIDSLVQHSGFANEVLDAIETTIDELDDRDWSILEQREFSSTPRKLDEIGEELGVTRERVRQLEARAREALEERVAPLVGRIAGVVRSRLGPVVAQAVIEEEVNALFADEQRLGTRIARQMLTIALGYSVVDQIAMDDSALAVVELITDVAFELADPVGLINEDELRARLPDEAWNEFWNALTFRAGLPRVFGQLVRRATIPARIKAAVISAGQPITKDHIAELVGLDPKRVGAQLSRIDGVARADKIRWGLEEWIDDVYEGIPAEIVQRIEEDGGATRLERLVTELPRMFGVSEASVRAHVQTPQFTLTDGYVSVADSSSIRYRDLDDVIDGRDESGMPYWTFNVKEQYFNGYSLMGFPPELAKELGCGPNEKIRVPLRNPAGFQDLSVSWRTSAVTGASLGYLAAPLRRVAVEAGDDVRLVLRPDCSVELRKPVEHESSRDTPTAGDLLEQLKRRRKVL